MKKANGLLDALAYILTQVTQALRGQTINEAEALAEIDPLGDTLAKKAIETLRDSRATKTKSRYYLEALQT